MKPDIKILLIGLVAVVILAVYSFADFNIGNDGYEVRKADFAALYRMPEERLGEADSVRKDTMKFMAYASHANEKFYPDSAQNILFFGDSMLEGLCRRFIDYADQNGHTLQTVIWYSSSSELWAKSDTLEYFLNKHKPTYVVVCLGSNELFVRDVDRRKENIKKIVKTLGDLPYVWISPPNWKDDTGINDAIISVVGKNRYFDSRNLELARGKDHAHPTFHAAAIWMDTIARWIQSPACANPILMEWPEKDVSPRNVTMLGPA